MKLQQIHAMNVINLVHPVLERRVQIVIVVVKKCIMIKQQKSVFQIVLKVIIMIQRLKNVVNVNLDVQNVML